MGGSLGNLDQIEHIVLLMLENRSFDNMVGWLYDPANPPPFDRVPRGQPFEGLTGKGLSNPIPPDAPDADRAVVPAGRADNPVTPWLDPGEGYAHTNRELYGTVLPAGRRCAPFHPPYNLPPQPPARPPMNGFVLDFYTYLRCNGYDPYYDDYKAIMQCFTPAIVPVLSTLASAYAVCDQWHCSVPSQTLTNRSFSLAATASGLVDNTPYVQWLGNDVETIFNRIQAARDPALTWRVYFDAADVFSLTWLILPRLHRYLFSHFAHMDRFRQDCRDGRLPSFSLIEPRLYVDPNDQHPPRNVLPGERLIYDVYQALRWSPNWEHTLLIITYDEHGGCFDHVPPPAAVPPDPQAPAGQFGFRFDRLGVRVPAVLVSPWIPPGTVFRVQGAAGADRPLDHTCIIRTVATRFGLGSLTARDAAAAGLGGVLGLPAPRRDTPALRPPAAAPNASPLSGPPRALLAAAVQLAAARTGQPTPLVRTTGEGLTFLRQARRRLAHTRIG